MGKTSDLSPKKVGQVAGLLKATNLSQYEIAKAVGVSRSSVRNINKKIDLGVTLSPIRSGNCGRPRSTTLRTDRKIRDVCLQNRKKPVRLLTKIIRDEGVNISQRTVQQRLAEMELIARKPARKPRLTPAMIKKRLEWAHKYKYFTVEDWNKVLFEGFYLTLNNKTKQTITNHFAQVIFSVESVFQVLTEKTKFVRRRPGEQNKPECIIPTVKHPPSIMVWSAISGKGLGPLYIVENTMRQDQYKKVLQNQLIPPIRKWFSKREAPIFMHDGAPCHKAKSITAYLNEKKIKVLDWPGNSPDMNPIENAWELLKRKVAQTPITTKSELVAKLQTEWQDNSELKNTVQSCINSMPRRIMALIAAKGQHTKY